MRRLISLALLILVSGVVVEAWAGAEEEVARAREQRVQAFNEGNLEAFVDSFADSAVVTPPGEPFRIEGKDAIRAYYAGLFQAFPTRQVATRQSTIRLYEGTTAVVNTYAGLTLVDRNGKATITNGRASFTYVKIGGRWLVVDQHSSALPGSQ
jgi:uncharacterized protein (TIGR02246 family)